jgi:hypothetical protein
MTTNNLFGPEHMMKYLAGDPGVGERFHLTPAFHNPVGLELADGRMLTLTGIDIEEGNITHGRRLQSGWGALMLTEVQPGENTEPRILATSTRGFMRFKDGELCLEFNSTASELEIVNRSEVPGVTVRAHRQDVIRPWSPRGPHSGHL